MKAVRGTHSQHFAHLVNTIDRIADDGPARFPERYKPLGDGINEFKAGTLRILCFEESNCIICTNGFVKASAKTPIAAINLARYLRSNFLVAIKNARIPIEP